ncbi:MAG: DUF4372 domain-containing protein [Pseudomonadales bacterium]|nr:DUF4372 domain-containing protein [Pseudomonadales bacterium]
MAHFSTILSQMLKLVPRHEFGSLAKRHDGVRRSDACSRWKQFAVPRKQISKITIKFLIHKFSVVKQSM